MQQPVIPFDLKRMLFGDAPPEFIIEAFFRGLSLYLFMLFVVKFLGKRMVGQLTNTEMMLVFMLGTSLSVAMQDPEEGVLVGFVVLGCTFLFERLMCRITIASRGIEKLSFGNTDLLVKDGVLQTHKLELSKITREQIFAALRKKQVQQLGQVERFYHEPSGTFSLYEFARPRAGLAVLPDDGSYSPRRITRVTACTYCGNTNAKTTAAGLCTNCSNANFTPAIL